MVKTVSLPYVKNYFNTLYLAIPNYGLGRHDSGMVVPDYGVYVFSLTIVIMLIVALGKNGLGEKKWSMHLLMVHQA